MGSYGDFDGNSRVIVGDDRRIAVVHATKGCKEDKANARVISCAPELLAMVKRFQLYFETYSMQDMAPDQLRGELEPDVFAKVMKDRKEIEDLIAKAEGKS